MQLLQTGQTTRHGGQTHITQLSTQAQVQTAQFSETHHLQPPTTATKDAADCYRCSQRGLSVGRPHATADRLTSPSRKYSLLINVDKTNVMASDGIACRILIQNELQEQVDTFPYLGSLIT